LDDLTRTKKVLPDGIQVLPDGVYQVVTPYLCAGFVIRNGKLENCAPILAKNFLFWKKLAKRIGD
jgi:hypothetical protein